MSVRVRLAEGSNSYVIRDVDIDDEGRYFCRVTNTFGSEEVHVDVKMLGQSLNTIYARDGL